MANNELDWTKKPIYFWMAIGLIAFGLIYFGSQSSEKKQVEMPEQVVTGDVNGQAPTKEDHHDHHHDHQDTKPKKNGESEKPLEDKLDKEFLNDMRELKKNVDQLGLFDQRALDEFRAQAEQLLAENPEAFTLYALNKVENLHEESVQTAFFFVEVLVNHHDEPVGPVHDLLNMESKVPLEDEDPHGTTTVQKMSMTKAFAMENLFQRKDKGRGFDTDQLAVIEKDLVRFASKEKDLSLVRESLGKLKKHYNYDSGQLEQLVKGRTKEERVSYEDILAD